MHAKNIWLIDGSSYLYRAFYALPPLTTPSGEPTGAVYGVINMLKRLQISHRPDVLCIVFDPPGDTARNALYPAYKANRSAMPDDLKKQVTPLFNIIKAMGLPLLQVDNEEADDVIGTLAMQAKTRGHHVTISTADKDFAQLVCDDIVIQNTMSNKTLDAEGVMEKFGVLPHQIIDFLALTGDTVDNIPGIPKVGPKTAAKWLNTYGSLQNLMQHADEISGKIGDNLRTHLDQLPLYQTLVTIKTSLSLPFDIDAIDACPVDQTKLHTYYHHLHFTKWAKELADAHPAQHTMAQTQRQYLTIDSQDSWQKLRTFLDAAPCYALNLETTSLDVAEAKVVGVAFAGNDFVPCYVPIHHPNDTTSWITEAMLIEALKPHLSDPKRVIVGHHLKYDIGVLAYMGIDVHAQLHDTLLMSYVLSSHQQRHDLKTLGAQHLNQTCTDLATLLQTHDAKAFAELPVAVATQYAALDADMTWQLYQHFQKDLAQQSGIQHVWQHIESPLVPILSAMERHGVLIDPTCLEALSASWGHMCQELEHDAAQLADETFNLASPKQLRHILYEKLSLPVHKKTPKGDPSTSEEALQQLVGTHPLPEIILKHRHLSKLKSTYADPIPKQMHPDTQRVHGHFNQAVTITGRLSSNHPNLQNIPVKTPQGREIRKAFIAPEGHTLLCADYSQVELRVMAHLSQDEKLLEAFERNMDVHSHTAATLFDVGMPQVTSEQRRKAKAINFGLMYGMSAFGLSKQLNIGRAEAQDLIQHYFERYPGVLQYMEATRAYVRKHGYVETLMGRRLYLPAIFDRNKMKQMGAERAAINGPMQGTSADMIKLAMVAIDQTLCTQSMAATMIMQVHDELIFEVALPELKAVATMVSNSMAQALTLTVPLVVNLSQGPSWGEQSPLHLDESQAQRSLLDP